MALLVRRHTLEAEATKDVCMELLHQDLVDWLAMADIIQVSDRRTRSLRSYLNEIGSQTGLTTHEFTWTSAINLHPSKSKAQASIYRTSGVMSCAKCTNPRALFVQLAFSNREAIGSNFLKSELVTKVRGHGNSQVARMALITGSRKFLNMGGWDAAYGDTREYIEFGNGEFSEVLKSRPDVIEISP